MKVTVICPGCHGTGSVKKIRVISRKCMSCHGTGKISKTLTEYKMN